MKTSNGCTIIMTEILLSEIHTGWAQWQLIYFYKERRFADVDETLTQSIRFPSGGMWWKQERELKTHFANGEWWQWPLPTHRVWISNQLTQWLGWPHVTIWGVSLHVCESCKAWHLLSWQIWIAIQKFVIVGQSKMWKKIQMMISFFLHLLRYAALYNLVPVYVGWEHFTNIISYLLYLVCLFVCLSSHTRGYSTLVWVCGSMNYVALNNLQCFSFQYQS